MLGYNGRTAPVPTPLPSPPPTELELEPEPSDIFALGLDEAELAERILLDAKFEADAEREAAEEEQQPAADLEQAAILESCRLAHDQGNAACTLERADQQLLQRVMAVSRERLPTEEAGRLLMEAERQRMLELNARALAEETRREDERLAMIAESIMRRRFEMIQQVASAPASPATARYRPGRESMARAKNDSEAGPSRPPTDGE
jgi:hypothetical protein